MISRLSKRFMTSETVAFVKGIPPNATPKMIESIATFSGVEKFEFSQETNAELGKTRGYLYFKSAEDKQKSLYDTNFDISMMTDRPEIDRNKISLMEYDPRCIINLRKVPHAWANLEKLKECNEAFGKAVHVYSQYEDKNRIEKDIDPQSYRAVRVVFENMEDANAVVNIGYQKPEEGPGLVIEEIRLGVEKYKDHQSLFHGKISEAMEKGQREDNRNIQNNNRRNMMNNRRGGQFNRNNQNDQNNYNFNNNQNWNNNNNNNNSRNNFSNNNNNRNWNNNNNNRNNFNNNNNRNWNNNNRNNNGNNNRNNNVQSFTF